MSETQVLVTVSDFLKLFSGNSLLEGGFTFQWGGFIPKLGERGMGVGINFNAMVFKKTKR